MLHVMLKKTFIVTIDGPAASGKSTAARLLAERLGFLHVDTGAVYRALTLAGIETETDLDDPDAMAALFEGLDIGIGWSGGEMTVALGERDVSLEIRDEALTDEVKRVAGHPEVREKVTGLVRKLALRGSIVTEGRDQGTVVFPDADVKFFLDAELDERARRRQRELAPGAPLPVVRRRIEERDSGDRSRKVGSLTRAADAVYVDTSKLSIEEMVDTLAGIVEQKLRPR